MPIISRVGARSWKTRSVYGILYAVLTLGAATMVYPFCLMLSGSVKSIADSQLITPYPEFWFDDTLLFQKYAESKHNADLALIRATYNIAATDWRKIPAEAAPAARPEVGPCQQPGAGDEKRETGNGERETILDAFRRWRATPEARASADLGHTDTWGILPKNARNYRAAAIRRYGRNGLADYRRDTGALVTGWPGVGPPKEWIGRYRNRAITPVGQSILNDFRDTCPPADFYFHNPEGIYAQEYLPGLYGTSIDAYNAAHGTHHASYADIRLPATPPASEAERRDWSDFLRHKARLAFVRVDPAATGAFRAFVSHLNNGSISRFNSAHGMSPKSEVPSPKSEVPGPKSEVPGPKSEVPSPKSEVPGPKSEVPGPKSEVPSHKSEVPSPKSEGAFDSFDSIPFPSLLDDAPWLRTEWEAFLKSPDCLDEWLALDGPYERFRRWFADNGGPAPTDTAFPSLGTLALALDQSDCAAARSALRREFSTRNYRHVLEYIGMHGHGFRNTAVYCFLAVLACLLVNPLAAYALSRFRLRATYQVLLFCMATMAFPHEVSMIPAFVLTKRFPLWPLTGAIAALVVTFVLLRRLAPRLGDHARFLLSLLAAGIVGALLLPRLLGRGHSTVSLLNTWAALVLPGMANGYSIFLLKGFFDSMPKELYEAADIDGATEWTKFWMLTMSLSKPILAVLALNAFTHAYGAFMQALIIMPDERMWTLMVWIYQLQTNSQGSVVYASLVLAAIPTFLIFAFCQNIILRGIVVPTEK